MTTTRMLSVRIPSVLHASLRVHCARVGETIQDFVARRAYRNGH